MSAFIAIAVGYLIGSIPFAFLLARKRGIDLRMSGSGNIGAANVLRTVDVSTGVLAMALDAVKGAAAVLLAERMSSTPGAPVAAGLASVLGHVYPAWLRFRGGKGVATATGAFAVLAPAAVAIASGVFIVAVLATRMISVGSIGAALTLMIATALGGSSGIVIIAAVTTGIIIVARHRGNITRLAAGTERRIGGA